jgi:branched-chain amino acid transport system substrate-binding protein
MNRRFRVGALATVALAVVSIAAVGASVAGTRSVSTHRFVFGPASWKGANKSAIKVGLSISQTGAFAASGQYQLNGYKLFVSQLNKRGGWLGRPVQLVVYDDQSNPGTAVLLYEKLVTQDHVDLLIGPYSSGVTQAALAIPEKYHMVMLDPGGSAPNIYSNVHWNFQAIARADGYLLPASDICRSHGGTTIGIFVNSSTPFTTAEANALQDHATKEHLKVSFVRGYPSTTSDFSSVVLGAKASDPDCLVGATNVADSIGLVREIARSTLHPKLVAASLGPVESTFITSLGNLANGVLGNTQWWPTFKTPGNKQFIAGYRKLFKGQAPDYHSALGYTAMQVLDAAIKKTRSLDQTKLRNTIAHMAFHGVAGFFKVDSNGLQSGFRTYMMQWQNGKAQLVFPPRVATAKLVWPYTH